MTTAYTSLLGLALPVTGELSGTWGDTVNTAITSLLDTAVAGTTSITVDADITLSTTTGASNEARQAIILWNPASGTTTRNITAPAQSKMYTVINASGGTQSIVIRGAGPTTGVTIAKGESAQVAWNGSDFVKVGSSGGAITFTNLTVTGNTILGDAAADTLTVNATSTFAAPVSFQALVNLPSTGRSAAAALTVTAPAFLYGVASTYTDTASSGTIAAMAPFYSLARPTLSTSNVTTYTNAATLYIANSPAAGGSATITNPYALYVAAGANYFGGVTTLVGNVTLSTLTSGRVPYASTAGLLVDSANLLYSGTDLTVYGLTVGRGAGAVSTNTAVGASALAANTTGSNQVAIGVNALNANTTGIQNIAVGTDALLSNQTGNYNTSAGVGSLRLNTASNNTAFGWTALNVNSSGGSNTAIGNSALQSNTTASNNTAVGYQAAYSGQTASQVTAIGHQALYSNTTAQNSALGFQALYSNTSGYYNVAVGEQALFANTSGINNAAFGFTALRSNTTASNNTAVGYQAGYSNTTGTLNTFVGYQSGYSNTGAGLHTFIGYRAGYSTTGGTNAAFGSDALFTNTTGDDNTAVGSYRPLFSNTTGSQNIAVGREALRNNTTASGNTAVGYQAVYSNVTGTENVGVGYQALYSNTGSYNTAVGYRSLRDATTAVENTAMGDSAGQSLTTGGNNTAIGSIALVTATTGADNTAVGKSSLRFATTGLGNTALGSFALLSNTTASYNTAVGYQAGYSATTGTYNTFVGIQTGYNTTTGNSNTFVGTGAAGSAGAQVTTGSRNTILGAYDGNQGGLDIRTANNYIVLSDGAGNPRQWYDPSGYGYLGVFNNATSNTRKAYVVPGAFNFSGAYLGTATSDGRGASLELLSHSDVSNSGGIRLLCSGDVLGDTQRATIAFSAPTTAYSSLSYTNAISFSPAGIGLGNGTYATSGTGITFPATQSASSNANTLDDYEEGTWTPAWFGTTTNPTITYSEQTGLYIKIGKMVYFSFRIVTSASTGGVGNLSMSGLPFLAANVNTPGFTSINFSYGWLSSGNAVLALGVAGNAQTMVAYNEYAGFNSNTQTTATALNGGVIYITGGGCYQAA